MSMAAALISFAGCQKNEVDAMDPSQEGSSTFEFVAKIAQDATKTTLDPEGYKVDWEAGDVIYMVTTDGTWGAPYADDKDAATIAEFTYDDGKFTTESTIADAEYTFNAMYARADQKSFHRGSSTTHKLEAAQSQDCTNPTAHIKENDALVGTFTATTPITETVSMTMRHIYTLMQVDVVNNTDAEIIVTEFEMTADGADLAGIFNVESFGETTSISTKSGASPTITVNVANGTVAESKSLPVYFVMAPLSNYSGDVTFKVTDAEGNTYTKTVALNGISFEAGKYNTTPYTISSADVVEPEPANVTWDLSKDNTSEVSATKIAWTSDFAEMYCEKGGAGIATNNYYGGNSDNRTSTRFYKNSILTIAPKAGYKITSVVFTATSNNYASALNGSTWTNASAEVNSTTVTVTPTNGTQPMTATIGDTCGFTSVVVYYTENEGGETPEPEPKTLVSIAVENPQIEYTVGDSFVEPTVKATYDDASTATVKGATFTGNDLESEGTKEVTVSYTEGDVTATTTYTITVSPAEILVEDGTYVIAVKEEGVYYAASIEANGTRRAYVELSYSSGEYVSHDSKIVWTIANSGAGIIVSSGEQYWGAVKNGISLVETASVVSVAKSETEGAFYLSADCGSDGVRYLAKNGTYGFGFYAEAEDVYLIPAIFVELPTLETPVVDAVLNATGTGIDVSWTAVDNATSYVVSCTNQADQTVTSGTECSFIDLAAGNYTISVTAKAENYNSATSNAVTVIVPAAEGEVSTYVFLASDLTAGTSYNTGTVNGAIAYKLGSSSKTGTLTFPSGYSEITFYAVGWTSGTNNLAVTNGTINNATSVTLQNNSIASGSLNNGFSATGTFDDTYKYTIKVTDTSKSVVLSLKRGIVWGFEGVPAN